jgi:hypothetical protein
MGTEIREQEESKGQLEGGQTDVQEGQGQGLSEEELKAQEGEQLPDREQMSLINANLAAPINAAVAANVASDGSIAYANAEQTNEITQSNG